MAGLEGACSVASILSRSPVSNAARSNHTNRLPHGEESNEKASVLRNEFQCYGRVDGNVTPETDTSEEIDAADGAIVVFWGSLR